MKFKLKKLIALGLTLAMTCSALSMPAYALNVVDNPEVSTDGTNSVDSSTFETVEITTDENGNTVIGTDETESETTTPTEGGEETTPPTTEGGGETTIPPTTEGGEETTIPPTTEGGETTTPPTTEGGEETTPPPTTEGSGETTTPPEVIDPGFGVKPVDPEVPPTEGGETEVPEVPENPDEEAILDKLGQPMLMMSDLMLMGAYALRDVEVSFVDEEGNPFETRRVPVPESNIIDMVNKEGLFDYTKDNRHYKFVNATVGDDEVVFVGSYEDPNTYEEYTYYSTNGLAAVELKDNESIHFNYKEYRKINFKYDKSLGTVECDSYEVYKDDVVEAIFKPTRGNKLVSYSWIGENSTQYGMDWNEIKESWLLDGTKTDIKWNQLNPGDTTIKVEFENRTEPYRVRITNPEVIGGIKDSHQNVNLDGSVIIRDGENWSQDGTFGLGNTRINGLEINGVFVDCSNIDYNTGIFSSCKENILSPIDGLNKDTTFNLAAKRSTSGWSAATITYYQIYIGNVSNDINITLSVSNTNWILADVQLTKCENTTLYYTNSNTPDKKLSIFEAGSQIALHNDGGATHYFYFTPNPGYEVTENTLIKDSNNWNTKYTNPRELTEADANLPGYNQAVSAGLKYVFTVERESSWRPGTDKFGVSCTPIDYKVQYDVADGQGTAPTDNTIYTINDENRITLKEPGNVNDNYIFLYWLDSKGNAYYAGDTFEINPTTYSYANEQNIFEFTGVFVNKDNTYTVEHYFETETGEYGTPIERIGGLSDTTENKTVFALKLNPDEYPTVPAGFSGYEFNPNAPETVFKGEILPNGELTLKLYYTIKRDIKYVYTVNGNPTTKVLTEQYSKYDTLDKLYTAPNSTRDGKALHFAGWKDVDGKLYAANQSVDLSGKPNTTFTAVYYEDVKGYTDSSEEIGYKGGKVDNGAIFGDVEVEVNSEKTNACVYGTTSIPEGKLGDYKEIGFVISSYNNAPTTVGGFKATVDDTVYGKIKVNGKYNEPNADGHYYFGVNFNLCDNKAVKEFTATPYVTSKDGTIIYGAPVDINFNK